MKKLFLLLAGGVSVIAANAQENQSVVFNKAYAIPGTHSPKNVNIQKQIKTTAGALNKATSTQSAWFCFQDANINSNTAAPVPYPIYNDTSLLVPANNGNAAFNWFLEGLGTSFDPTSIAFTPNGFKNATPSFPQPAFGIGAKNAYSIDSITVYGFDDRKSYNHYVDTLFIYLAATPAAGTAAFTYGPANFFVDTFSIPNGTFHVATMAYDSTTNGILSSKVTGLIKITKLLDSAAYSDSIVNSDGSNGGHIYTLNVPGGLSVPAGGKVVAYQQFKSGHQYPFNTSIDSANTWDVVSYALNGTGAFPSQLNNDYNSGLVMTGQERYWMNQQEMVNAGTQYILSSYFFVTAGFQDPFFAFHVNCTGCFNAGVANVSTIATASAYPNPATSEVFIPFTLSHNANVNVTVTNTLGQVTNTQSFSNVTTGKAAFNTSSFAAGVYFYTVEANGERTTGRFVVAR
ncbi:MAG: T9SS type A sorting domain-containing protein [Flavipsychrobacter sp.]|nr:T9SS type A sorting domain-containing protein [Flavipsychrobacter sp.]